MNKQENDLLIFTYNILYINDMIYNNILNIKSYIRPNEHKETIKIYNALYKKNEKYYDIIDEIMMKYKLTFSEFCGYIDDEIDPLINELYDSIYELIITQVDEDTSKLISHIELTLIISDIAKCLFDNVKNDKKKFKIDINRIEYLNLVDINKNIKGLADWLAFLYRKEIDVNLNESEEIISKFKALTNKLVDTKMYYDAINRLNELKINKKRNKKVMVVLNDNDNQKEFYNSISDCAKKLNTSRYMIYKCDKTGEKFRKLLTIKILK